MTTKRLSGCTPHIPARPSARQRTPDERKRIAPSTAREAASAGGRRCRNPEAASASAAARAVGSPGRRPSDLGGPAVSAAASLAWGAALWRRRCARARACMRTRAHHPGARPHTSVTLRAAAWRAPARMRHQARERQRPRARIPPARPQRAALAPPGAWFAPMRARTRMCRPSTRDACCACDTFPGELPRRIPLVHSARTRRLRHSFIPRPDHRIPPTNTQKLLHPSSKRAGAPTRARSARRRAFLRRDCPAGCPKLAAAAVCTRGDRGKDALQRLRADEVLPGADDRV